MLLLIDFRRPPSKKPAENEEDVGTPGAGPGAGGPGVSGSVAGGVGVPGSVGVIVPHGVQGIHMDDEHDEHHGLDEASLKEHEEVTKVKVSQCFFFGC